MSASTPDDLAVAFRSLARRRREALGDADAATVADLGAELDGHIAAAASALGAAADPESVGAAIGARSPDDWDGATLDELRRHALAAGEVLRRIEARARER